MHWSTKLSIIVALTWFASGCATAPTSKPQTTAAATAKSFNRVDVPAKIAEQSQNHWIKVLYLLPLNHPDRAMLRDRLVHSMADRFGQLRTDDLSSRKGIAEEVFALHSARDFQRGQVAVDAKSIAHWLVETYEKRGDEAMVLAGLRLLMLIEPREAVHQERYRTLTEWSESVRQTISDRQEQLTSLIRLYQKIIRLIPEPETVDRLAELYVERYRLILDRFQSNDALSSALRNLAPFEAYRQGQILQTFPINIIHIFFVLGKPAAARLHLEELVSVGAVPVEYIELLDRLDHDQDRADSFYTLARHLAPIDTRAGLRACILARASDPQDPRFPLCVGSLLERLDCSECALEFYAETAEIAPDEEMYTEVLTRFKGALTRVHLAEKIAEASRGITLGDKLVAKALELRPDEDSKLPEAIAELLYQMGEVEFDDGNIPNAIAHLTQTYDVLANVPTLLKLAEVYYLKNDFRQAITVLDRASEMKGLSRDTSGFWRAFVLERTADSLSSLGKNAEAEDEYRQALSQWESAKVTAEQAATVAIRRGVIFDRLGDAKASKASFEIAVRLNPDRQATYAELLSYLVTRGHLDLAIQFYRLAYNQDRIEAMWKIYYSLWIEGLSLRMGKGSFEMARNYLMHSDDDTWQGQIARYFSGKITLDELKAAASNVGQQVEADYYGALLALSEGRKKEARAMLERVVASNLLGFFEYRMARSILQNKAELDP